jgi:hypothetical protein
VGPRVEQRGRCAQLHAAVHHVHLRQGVCAGHGCAGAADKNRQQTHSGVPHHNHEQHCSSPICWCHAMRFAWTGSSRWLWLLRWLSEAIPASLHNQLCTVCTAAEPAAASCVRAVRRWYPCMTGQQAQCIGQPPTGTHLDSGNLCFISCFEGAGALCFGPVQSAPAPAATVSVPTRLCVPVAAGGCSRNMSLYGMQQGAAAGDPKTAAVHGAVTWLHYSICSTGAG